MVSGEGRQAVGFGDGICIENNIEHCVACHDIMLGHDILFLEVLKNIDHLQAEIFLISYPPASDQGLDSSPVNILVLEGVPGFSPGSAFKPACHSERSEESSWIGIESRNVLLLDSLLRSE